MSFKFYQKAFYNYDSKHFKSFLPLYHKYGKELLRVHVHCLSSLCNSSSIVIIKSMSAHLSHLHINLDKNMPSVSYVFQYITKSFH